MTFHKKVGPRMLTSSYFEKSRESRVNEPDGLSYPQAPGVNLPKLKSRHLQNNHILIDPLP